ncbi:Pre-rRNA-processing protein esf1 [Psilocybe cubensis]|uniref:Pre-rRNA-processing protein esf1 n=2 Tax=Psilocybe cubensis TaxID=181762 RepID=A0ACB8HH21_PSICU|nr:Pre-rRNA-processing protein esf1 [Psilocybe cubensis]KAH9486989.1 Pre-rRNA-processing protein esf1 [Psilocybe cubensis]
MSDPRFARLKSDPRFRRPKTKNNKVVIDERFKSVFEKDKKKPAGRKVDKYGRPISDTQDQDDLKRFYRLERDAEQHEDAESAPRKPDLARGEVLLESSDEEDEEGKAEEKDSDEEEDDGFVTLGRDSSRPIAVPNDDEEEDAEIDLDEDTFADLEAQAANYAKAHQDEDENEDAGGQRSRRLAIVNLDWDHVRASHLYKICASLVSPTAPVVRASAAKVPERTKDRKGKRGEGPAQVNVVRGKVLSVRVYPSEFGKERMAREETEGPPPEIFKKKDLDVDEINEKTVFEVGGEDEYDEDALRKYQLERLRYYYAVVTCDTVDAASHIYNELEGTELERSANVFDMSFVPDDMTFENEPRDEATDELNTTYKAVEFVTDALRHSKVKLTWDEDDPERTQITRRALTRKEIEESDFRAYIANTSSESEGEDAATAPKKKKKDKKASRDKLRALLLGGNDEAMPEGWGDDAKDDVDMEITFTPGLTEKKDEENETSLEKYQRKMREKRKKRKEELKEAKPKEKEKEKVLDDEFFEPDSDQDKPAPKTKKGKTKPAQNEEASSKQEATAEELALLVASDNPNAEPKHFNLKSVIKSEKQKKRRKGRKGKLEDDAEAQEDFTVDVKDERFKALFEDHKFAIDPSNPHFKKTKAMSALLDERQRRQRELWGDRDESIPIPKKDLPDQGSKSLQNLVESVKRKSAAIDAPGQGKRRKL